jgi:Ran GTPase-activating protein 1
MPQNGIWMDGIIALAKGLAKNPDLEYIDLQDNTFTHGDTLSGVEAWASSLPAWKNLHTLNLSDCVLSPEGSSEAPALIAALASGSNPKLRSLSLQNNNLEKETFALVAENIGAGFGNLSSLELQWNEYDEDDDDVLEHVKTIRSAMRKRRGRLIVTDEDEEEDEAEAEAEAVEGEAETLVEADIKAEETGEPQAPPSKEDDDLAQLMSKVTINNS